jgi:hypothetical protein
MKIHLGFFYIVVLLSYISCIDRKQSVQSSSSEGDLERTIEIDTVRDKIHNGNLVSSEPRHPDISCWTGMIDGKIPVKLWYQKFDDILVGEILYPDSKTPEGIPIIGVINENKYIELREFDKKGIITGYISGIPLDNYFNPEWFNPAGQKMRRMRLSYSDSIITPVTIEADLSSLEGKYFYSFGPNGYSGDLEILNQRGSEMQVRILSTTGDLSGYNIAELELVSASLSQNIAIIRYPFNEECLITLYFYKDFIKVKEENCLGEFGHNATLEGIFYKVSN